MTTIKLSSRHARYLLTNLATGAFRVSTRDLALRG